jgi:hypothetical protein
LLIIVGVAGGCAIILTLILVAYCCFYKRHHSKKSTASNSTKHNSSRPRESAPDSSLHSGQSRRRSPQRSLSFDDAYAPERTHDASRSIQRARSFDEIPARSAFRAQGSPRRSTRRAARCHVARLDQSSRLHCGPEQIHRSQLMSSDPPSRVSYPSAMASSPAAKSSLASSDRPTQRAQSFDGSFNYPPNSHELPRRGGFGPFHAPHQDSALQRSRSFDNQCPSSEDPPQRVGAPPVTPPSGVRHHRQSLPSSPKMSVPGGRSVWGTVGGIPAQQLVPTPPSSRRSYAVQRCTSFDEAESRSTLPPSPSSTNRTCRTRSKSMDNPAAR